jgi:O-antigen/teichoic acid export membrane protein
MLPEFDKKVASGFLLKRILSSALMKDTFIYSSASVISALLGFAVLPVLTRYLTPDDYGTLEIFRLYISLLTGILLLGGNTIILGEYYRLNDKERGGLLHDLVATVLFMSLTVLLIYFVTSYFIDTLPSMLKLTDLWIFIGIISAGASSVVVLTNTLFQIRQEAFKYALFVIGMLVCNLLITLILIVRYDMNWTGMAIGIFISSTLFMMISFKILFGGGVGLKTKFKYSKLILTLGPTLAISHVAGWINEGVGKIMVSNMIDLEATGAYSIGYKFGMVVAVIVAAYSRSWLSFFFKNINSEDDISNNKVVIATYISIIGLFLVSFSIGLIGPKIMKILVDVRYANGSSIIMIICMAYWVNGVGKLFTGYLVQNKRTGIYSSIIIISGILNIILSYFLIPQLGMTGAAWATLFSFSFDTISTILISAKIHPMPWFTFKLK